LTIQQVDYAGDLLLTRIGQLHDRPGKAPLCDAWLHLRDGLVVGLGEGSPNVSGIATRQVDGGIIIPAPVDGHTHLLFGGDRCDEFASRARGESYEQRLAAGGGIHATVAATAAASDEELLSDALQRIERMRALGTGAVEVKSGYGLSLAAERRLLRLLAELRQAASLPVFPTLLVHLPPPDAAVQQLVDTFCAELIPEAAALGFGFDVFIEQGAFSGRDAEPMLHCAADLGMRIHVHADQLSASGASSLAAAYRARSAEHLEYASDADITAMAEAGVTANLLPGAWLQTGCGRRPPVAQLRAAGVAMAIATDLNPGSSYVYDTVLAAALGISAFGLSCDEALYAITEAPARLLGAAELGHLGHGARAAVLWMPLPDPSALFQRLGAEREGLVFRSEEPNG
jgi:imidazolonepropionase